MAIVYPSAMIKDAPLPGDPGQADDLLPAETTALNLAAAKSALRPMTEALDAMDSHVESLGVSDETSQSRMVECVAETTRLKKRIDDKRKEIISDADQFVRAVNTFVRVNFSGRVDKIISAGKAKLSRYSLQLEQERRKREAEERARMAELQKKIDAEAKAAQVEPVKLPEPVVPKQTGPVRTEAGSASQVKVWKFRVLDKEKVPREFLEIDTKAVNLAIKNGRREIDGIKIYEDVEIRVRTF